MILLSTVFLYQIWRETDVKPRFHCQDLEGERRRLLPHQGQVPASVSQIINYDLEPQCKPRLVYQREVAFVFPNVSDYVLSCVKLHMYFYNMLLILIGYGSMIWSAAKMKRESLQLRDFWRVFVRTNYDKDNPAPRRSKPTPNLRMVMAINLITSVSSNSVFNLVSDANLGQRLRRYRGLQGMLDTEKLSQPDLMALRQIIQLSDDEAQQLPTSSADSFTAIADSGCSFTCTNDRSDFCHGTMTELPKPLTLGGIAGGLEVRFQGTVCWEAVDDLGNVVPIQTKAYLQEQLPCRLLSPQAFLTHSSQRLEDHFRVYFNRAELHQRGSKVLTIPFDRSFLPRLTLFRKGTAQAQLEGLLGSLVDGANSNLAPKSKQLLKWHYKLGHLGFRHVRQLGLGGYLDTMSLNLWKADFPTEPKCAACCYGKQARKPDHITPAAQKPATKGSLTREQLQPGDRIFSDQLESRVRGRLLHTAGREPDRDKFCASTLFCDAASGYIHVEHQVTLSASDTIISKNAFERFAKEHGVAVKEYHTNNGVYKSSAFQDALQQDGQSICFSGVGAKWQNGIAENAIRIVTSRARTMMIHAAIHWPEQDDKSLWPLAVSHAAFLYNHTPRLQTGIAPIEVFSGTKSDHQVLRNAHPWGCPVYVLEPSLTQAGGKIPKWQPRSRRAQYVGFSPVHSENIGLVRNLHSGFITPQYHLVFDDWFETVHAPDGPEPRQWIDMCIYQRMQTYFDPDDKPPPLAPEWLTLEQNSTATRGQQGRKLAQDLATRDNREDLHFKLPTYPTNHPTPSPPPAPPPSTPKPTTPLPYVAPVPTTGLQQTREPQLQPSPRHSMTREQTHTTTNLRRSQRNRVPPDRLQPTMKGKSHGYLRPSSMFAAAMLATSAITPQSSHMLHQQAIGLDPIGEFQENIHPWTTQTPWALKAKASKDPDLPSIREALTGPHAEPFWQAMEKEISTLEAMGTWEVVPRASMPKGATAIPGTWAFRVKRYPDGRLNKFKARWCVMGNRMEKGVHYFEDAYSPLVGWPTVRSALLLSAAAGWKSRQVDFTNAFCQAPQKDLIFVELPQYYKPRGFEGQDVVLRLKKSLYGQVTSPKLFWEHLQKGMLELGFVQSLSDPCLFIHPKVKLMVLNYCDDQIWLSPDDSLIETYVKKLQALGYELTLEREGDMFAFLGIDFKRHGSTIELSQRGLIEKVINYVDLANANPKSTPAATAPLGSDKSGPQFAESWSYAAAVGMLLYLSSNTRPDIQFAVHQVARFSHSPKQSHGQAIKRIVRYLAGTKDRGIQFQPDLKAGLDCYVDADFAGLHGYEDDQDPVSVKSRTGFVLTLFGCPIIWSSKLQTEITLSSTAAEYVAFSMAMRELLPMRALLKEMADKLHLEFAQTSLVRSTVFEDNQGCLSMVNTPKMSSRNKYLSLKYHFFRSHIGRDKGIEAKWIETTKQKADIFTKGLPEAQFMAIRKLLMGW